MSIKHVTQHIEAYLDHQLSLEERRLVEAHLATCPSCTRHLHDAQRVANELGPMLKTTLGQPLPPPALRQRVRQALRAADTQRQFSFPWAAWGRVLNAVGTLAIMAVLAFGAFVVIRGQPEGGANVSPEIQSLRPGNGGGELSTVNSTLRPTPPPEVTPSPTLPLASSGDTLPKSSPLPVNPVDGQTSTTPSVSKKIEAQNLLQPESGENKSNSPIVEPTLPRGTIAFAFFNPAPNRQLYETHLINSDGADHRLFPLDGVSEPALSQNGQQIAYRAWSEPTSPRSLLSSDLTGVPPHRIGGFWEDAQPDWSPTENRIIFASQREVDRRWRLYASWGDGTAEINLRREGKSPTFAPDGYRFAFESCDSTANRCGLWIGDLENSEYDSYPFLEDPLAKSPDWSPVGEQIAYMANPNDNWDLYLVNSNGSGVHRLTTNPAIDGLPVWSPDGEWLAFLSNRGGDWGIWVLHVDSTQIRQVFKFDGGTFTPPARSPYGERNWWDEQLSWSR
jgi:anti-sigma factor RsiW